MEQDSTEFSILIALVCAITFLLVGNVINTQIFSSSTSSPSVEGIISSLILDIPPYTENSTNDMISSAPVNITDIPKFILAGDWNIILNNSDSITNNLSENLNVIDMTADFVGITTDGKGSHTHQISDFTPISDMRQTIAKTNSKIANSSVFIDTNTFSLDGNAHLSGYVDVSINNNKVWEDVKANITVSNGKTIEIRLDDEDVNFHFGKGQAIYGLVNGLYLS